MCIYHYWFENGRRILEKPAENLLKWHEIQMPFCFCWANETWSRTWKKYMDTNVWFGKGDMAQKDTILLKQIYGRERDWEVHFQYLLPFFKDDRYIKLNGKPVFVIFKPSQIFQLWEMLTYFEKQIKFEVFCGKGTYIRITNKVDKKYFDICSKYDYGLIYDYDGENYTIAVICRKGFLKVYDIELLQNFNNGESFIIEENNLINNNKVVGKIKNDLKEKVSMNCLEDNKLICFISK